VWPSYQADKCSRSVHCLPFLVSYVERVGSQESLHYVLFEEWHTPSLPISNCPRNGLSDHSTTILKTQVQISCNAVANFNTTSSPWSFGSFETFKHVIFEDSESCLFFLIWRYAIPLDDRRHRQSFPSACYNRLAFALPQLTELGIATYSRHRRCMPQAEQITCIISLLPISIA
jgi:hypothetical protein